MNEKPIITAIGIAVLMGAVVISAEWMQTNGPYGGIIQALLCANGRIVAGSSANLFISSDQGASWTRISDTLFSGLYIKALGINDEKIFAGTSGGIFIGDKAGKNWTRPDSVVRSPAIYSMVVNGPVIYAGGDGMVFKSTDNGTTWVKTGAGIFSQPVSVLFIKDATIFSGAWNGLFVSTNGGDTWTNASAGITTPYMLDIAAIGDTILAATSGGIYISTDSGAYWTKSVAGMIDTVTTALAVNSTGVFVGTQTGVYYSADKGTTWIPANKGLANRNVRTLVESGENIFAGTFGGIFKTSDTSGWVDVNNGIIATTVNSLVVKGNNLFAGTSGGIFLSTDAGGRWNLLPTDSLTGQSITCMAPGVAQAVWAGTDRGKVFVSTDTGKTWSQYKYGLPAGISISCLAIKNAYTFAGTSGRGVYLANTSLLSWGSVNAGITDNSYVSALLATSSWVYCAADNGFYMMNTSYQKWNSVRTMGYTVMSMAENSVGDIYCGSRNHGLLLFEDTLSPKNTGIPQNLSVNSFAVDYQTMIAGTPKGVYFSSNNGAAWTDFSVGLAITSVKSVAINRINSALAGYAGVTEGGVWRRSLSEGVVAIDNKKAPSLEKHQCSKVFFRRTGSKVTAGIFLAGSEKVIVDICDLSGRGIAAIVHQTRQPGFHRITWNAENLKPGFYLVRLRTGRVGFNNKVLIVP
jgi:photosystem II stability/assembly factor-like uncharacterized protein